MRPAVQAVCRQRVMTNTPARRANNVDSILERIKELYRAQLARTGRIPNRLMLTPDDMLDLEKFLASQTCDAAHSVVICGTRVRTIYGMRFRHNPILKTSLVYFEES